MLPSSSPPKYLSTRTSVGLPTSFLLRVVAPSATDGLLASKLALWMTVVGARLRVAESIPLGDRLPDSGVGKVAWASARSLAEAATRALRIST